MGDQPINRYDAAFGAGYVYTQLRRDAERRHQEMLNRQFQQWWYTLSPQQQATYLENQRREREAAQQAKHEKAVTDLKTLGVFMLIGLVILVFTGFAHILQQY